MYQYFRGWRRKAGCITLALACVFIVIWVRSLIVVDTLQFDSGKFIREDLVSVRHHLIWGRIYEEGAVTKPSWRTSPIARVVTFDGFMELTRLNRSWRFCGFSGGKFQVKKSALGESGFCVIPYWSIVIPLTMLSAFLLLSKRQEPIQPLTAGLESH